MTPVIPPGTSPTLESEARAILTNGTALLEAAGLEPDLGSPATDIREALERLVGAALDAHASGHAELPDGELAALTLQAQDILRDVHERVIAHGLQLQDQVRAGLGRLRQLPSSAALVDRVCQEVQRSCGFKRVLLSRVVDDQWVPWVVYLPGETEREHRMAQIAESASVPLAEAHIERMVLESRRPAIVRDATGPAYGPLLEVSQSTSYVVAPITPAGRVVGFLHADHHDGTRVDEVDRNLLWTFAEGFGRIYERTELLERLRAQRHRVRETFETVETIMATVDSAEIELTRHAEEAGGELDGRATWEVSANAAIDATLTEREREVLALMVRGLNNSAIAERLVIKPGTVKSHVKHILRKLGAVNRAEAISRYVGGAAA